MADSWRGKQSSQVRTQRAVQTMAGGSMNGRIASASPVPDRKPKEPPNGILVPMFVQDDEPPAEESPTGTLWFDTDEPVF